MANRAELENAMAMTDVLAITWNGVIVIQVTSGLMARTVKTHSIQSTIKPFTEVLCLLKTPSLLNVPIVYRNYWFGLSCHSSADRLSAE